eukprot:1789464-Rhodomonas_salina.1
MPRYSRRLCCYGARPYPVFISSMLLWICPVLMYTTPRPMSGSHLGYNARYSCRLQYTVERGEYSSLEQLPSDLVGVK